MTRFTIGLVTVLAVVCTALGIQAAFDAERQSEPPYVAPPVAEASAPLAAVGGDTAQPVFDWIEGIRVEEVAVADVAGGSAVRSPVGSVGSGDCAALSAQLGLSESVLWRESRCSWEAFNATGCGGRGCVGPAQLDLGHFAPVSPWNSSASGSCADLDPDDPQQYAECVGRLPASAWG